MAKITAVLLVVTMFPARLVAQSADRIYEQLSKMPARAEVEVKLRSGASIRGRIVRFDKTQMELSGQPQPVPLTEIRSVKQIKPRTRPVWNPFTGFMSWKQAAITATALVLVGVLVAKNTR